MYSKVIPLLFIIVLVSGQSSNDISVDDIGKKVREDLPGLGNFNSSSIPSEEEVQKVLKEKCRQNSGSDDAFDALQTHVKVLKECIEDQLNATQIQLEVEEAKKTGSMDEVFGKYCKKYPEIYKCTEKTTEGIRACINDAEKEALDKAINITNELKEFICYKDGDRIAMFVAEGGVECLNSRQEALQACINKTVGGRIPNPSDFSLATLPTFLFTEKECSDFHDVRTCVNTELEKCSDSTPANIVDAFFKFLKRHLPCVENNKAPVASASKPNSANVTRSNLPILVVFISLLIKFSFY